MSPILRFRKFAVAVLACSLLCSCTVTTSNPKNPVFTTDDAGMAARLQRYVQCEHINVAGLEKETNGKVSSLLTVKIINGTNLPTGDERKSLGKTLARELKHDLKDPNEFGTYQVIFSSVSINAIGSASIYNTYLYKSEEL